MPSTRGHRLDQVGGQFELRPSQRMVRTGRPCASNQRCHTAGRRRHLKQAVLGQICRLADRGAGGQFGG